MIGYIYCYKNVLNGKIYIGQTYDINRRITEHKLENMDLIILASLFFIHFIQSL